MKKFILLGLNHLLKRIKRHKNIDFVELYHYRWDDCLSQSLYDYVAATKFLEWLIVESDSLVTDVFLRRLCSSLCVTESVKNLTVCGGSITTEGLIQVLSILKRNKKLESLTVRANFPNIADTLLSPL